MKMPKYLLRIGAQDYVIGTKIGVGALVELLSDALPVRVDHKSPVTITLEYADLPTMLDFLRTVSCQRIPADTVWRQKTQEGKVEVVYTEGKAPKASKALALRDKKREQPRLTRGQQLALLWSE